MTRKCSISELKHTLENQVGDIKQQIEGKERQDNPSSGVNQVMLISLFYTRFSTICTCEFLARWLDI